MGVIYIYIKGNMVKNQYIYFLGGEKKFEKKSPLCVVHHSLFKKKSREGSCDLVCGKKCLRYMCRSLYFF